MNIFDYVQGNKAFRQYKVGDALVIEYKCLLDVLESGYWTDQNYVFAVTSGVKLWRTDTDTWKVGKDEAAFVKRGHYFAKNLSGDDFCAVVVFLPDTFIAETIRKHEVLFPEGSPEAPSYNGLEKLKIGPGLRQFFDALTTYFEKDVRPGNDILRLKLEELILWLVQEEGNQIANYFQILASNEKVNIPAIMEANYHRHLKLEEFARLCGRSLSGFRRDFQAIYAKSPGQWIQEKRLKRAAYLLLQTNLPVVDASYEAGFANQSHFTRSFKKYFDVSPLEYRRLGQPSVI